MSDPVETPPPPLPIRPEVWARMKAIAANKNAQAQAHIKQLREQQAQQPKPPGTTP